MRPEPQRTTETRTRIVGEREIYEEDRDDALEEEMRKLDERGIEEFGRLESSERTIAIVAGRRWPQTANRTGLEYANSVYVIYGKSVQRAPKCGSCLY